MLFGTSGIRGLYGKDVTEDLAVRVGEIFGDIVLARDSRRNAAPISRAVASGALYAGNRVLDGGVAPTPSLAYGTMCYGVNGVMVTASHNPEEYTGIKLFRDGKEISKEDEIIVEDSLEFARGGDYTGMQTAENVDLVKPHMDLILRRFGGADFSDISVVIDTNGAASKITPFLLRRLGCRVFTVNSGDFGFYRESEPTPDALSLLSSVVRRTGADFGIAHDGDADRVVVVDEKGNVLPQDIQLFIAVDFVLSEMGSGNIVSTVESSLELKNLVESHGQDLILTPIGSTYISHVLDKVGGAFGGEPCGEYVFKDGVPAPDGIFGAAFFLDVYKTWGPFSELVKKYARPEIFRAKFKYPQGLNVSEFMQELGDVIEGEFPGEVLRLDGIRIEQEDGWFLIRPSGTEPVIRMTAEYPSDVLYGVVERLKSLLVNRFGFSV